jgi:hypothetical protein
MDDMLDRIDDYFNTTSDEEIKRDAIEAGVEFRCKKHPDFDPLNPSLIDCLTDCVICADLARRYAESERYGKRGKQNGT